MRKPLLYISVLTLSLLCACGSKETSVVPSQVPSIEPTAAIEPTEAVEPTVEPTYTQEPSQEPTATIEPTEAVEPTVEPTYTPVPTQEPTQTPVPTPSPLPTLTSTPSPTPSNTPVPTATSTPSPEPTPSSTPVPTPTNTPVPTVTPSPTPSSTPKPTATPTPEPTKAPVENAGNMMTWSGDTVHLENIGVDIPVLDDFNDLGLTEDGWFGDVDTPGYSDKQSEVLWATLEATHDALLDKKVIGTDANGFTITNADLSWHWTGWGATGDLEIVKNKEAGVYEVIVNTPLNEDIFTDKDVAPYSREILVAMLSLISSEPEELEKAIYDTIYNDYVIPKDSWGEVGDCLGYADYEASYRNHFVFRFKAK